MTSCLTARARARVLAAALALTILPLHAQDAEQGTGQGAAEDDKSILENFLQNNLSAAGRTVEVTGFQGALSSRAVMERLTVADDDGVWLTLEGATLDWTRSALLKGRLEIDALSAERIEIARRPVAVIDGPQAASSDFSLPELPISIDIGEISAASVVLGAPVLGMPAELRLDGGGRLEGGAGEATFTLERIDGAQGRFAVSAGYSNETGQIALDLDLDEGANGIVATLTGLPGGAPLAFTLQGTGPVDDFTADLALATDGTERIGGEVALARAGPEAATEFRADLAGDPSPLLAPDYRAFFGDEVRLSLAGARDPAGRFDLSRLEIATEALDLAGRAVIGPGGWPESAALTGAIASADNGPVVLPLGGDQTRVSRADIALAYDAAEGDDWRADITLADLSRADIQVAGVSVAATGALAPPAADGVPGFDGHVVVSATGIAGNEAGIAAALGPSIDGTFDFARKSGEPLRFSDLAVTAGDTRILGDFTLDTDVDKLDLIADGAVTLEAGDLARFAGLAGQPLTGAATLEIAGNAALPGGPFDVEISGRGQDLGIGIAEADRLFAGASTLSLAANRGEGGTEIERFDIRAPGATASGAGWLAASGSQLAARVDLPDAGLLAEGLAGAVALEANARQDGDDWQIALTGSGPGGARARFTGTAAAKGPVRGSVTASLEDLAPWSGLAGRPLAGRARITAVGGVDPATGAFDLDGSAETQDLGLDLGTADALIAGAGTAHFIVRRDAAGTLFVDRLELATPELDLDATGSAPNGNPEVALTARLRDLGLFVPGLPGAFTLDGTAALGEAGWQVQAQGDGPGGTTLRASGNVAGDAQTAALTLIGRAPLALANSAIAPRQLSGMAGFDLALNGPIALGSLAGDVNLEGARAAAPTAGIALDPLTGTVRLSGGRAMLDISGAVSSGGQIRVSGPVALTPPYQGDLAILLQSVGLRDEALYELTAAGNLTLSGPLAGGATVAGGVGLGPVELRIPETGFGVDGSLDGLTHVAAPAAVRATQARAGLTRGGSGGGGGAAYGLNITLEAPGQVFIRGRGLDAELGGTVYVAGSTANVVTTGDVQLIRGRLDILGNRLALTEGYATMRGSLDPFIHLVAETEADDITVTITVDGLASDPSVTFTSSPDLPEDEILARLVFGRGLDQISPFQALKLASAVATLSGKGGSGTIGRLREGFGLDDLDVTTGDDGKLAVSAGTYISDNVYSDVTIGAGGQAEINLNLSITDDITAKGSVSSDGSTGLGIFFEKDY